MHERWERRAVALVATITAIRLVVISVTGLSDTEAYYVGWGRHLALSYYDHPPLVAWISWAVTRLGTSPLMLRAPFVACAAVFGLLLYGLTARLFSPRAGFIAVATVLALPAFEMTSLLVNPEGLLAPLWVLYLLLLHDLGEHDEPWRPFLLGAVIGVAFLAKYTALLGVPIAIAYVATSPRARRWLRRPSFYLAGALALALSMPVVVWNAARGFPSVTLHLVERAAPPSLERYAANALHALGSQLMLFHPLVFPGLVLVMWTMLRRARHDERHRFLAWTSLPLLAFFFVMMVRVSDAEPHWTMMGYVPVAAAAGGLIDAALGRSARPLRAYLGASVAFSAGLLALYFVHMSTPALLRAIPPSVYNADADPINETLGWDEIRTALVTQADALGPGTVVATNHNVLCGHVEVALSDEPRVYCASPRRTQFDFVGRGVVPREARVVYLESDRYARDPALALPEHHCELVQRVDVSRGERAVNRVRLYACRPEASDDGARASLR